MQRVFADAAWRLRTLDDMNLDLWSLTLHSGLLLVLQKDRLSGLLPGGACPAPGINRARWGTKGKCATSSSCSGRDGVDSSLSVRDEASERLMASSDPTKSILIMLILQLYLLIPACPQAAEWT